MEGSTRRIFTFQKIKYQKITNCLVSRSVAHSSLDREVQGSNIGPVKSNTVLPTAHHRCHISLKEAVVPGPNDAEIGPSNLLQASAKYHVYNERFEKP